MNFSHPIDRTDEAYEDIRSVHKDADQYGTAGNVDGTWIADLIAAIWRKRFILSFWIIFCFVFSLVFALRAVPEYVASARIALEPRLRLSQGSSADSAASATPILDSAQAESQILIIRSVRNLDYVFNKLNLESDPTFAPKAPGLIGRLSIGLMRVIPVFEEPKLPREGVISREREIAFQNFSDRVQARRLGQSYVIELSFQGPNPEAAARITNSIAAAYIRDQVQVHAVSEQRGTEFLQGRIALIQAEKKAADEAVATGVITDFQFPDSDARIVGAALRPLFASYPQTKLFLLFGIVFGSFSGIALIAVANNFDRTVRSSSQVRRVLGLDCLVVIPRMRSKIVTETTAIDHPRTGFADALRMLRAILLASDAKSSNPAFGFVSCDEGDGCSSVSANLACLLAASNCPVLLIDANFQKPDLTRRFAPDAGAGLDTFILSSATGDALPEIKLNDALGFVPAAANNQVSDPNVFLGTQAVRAALANSKKARTLLLDLPPLKSSSDAQSVGNMLSGIVLVASLHRTKLDDLEEVVRALRAVNSPEISIILNDPIPRRSRRFKEMMRLSKGNSQL